MCYYPKNLIIISTVVLSKVILGFVFTGLHLSPNTSGSKPFTLSKFLHLSPLAAANIKQ